MIWYIIFGLIFVFGCFMIISSITEYYKYSYSASKCKYCTYQSIYEQNPPMCIRCKYYYGSIQYIRDKRKIEEELYGKSYFKSRNKRNLKCVK